MTDYALTNDENKALEQIVESNSQNELNARQWIAKNGPKLNFDVLIGLLVDEWEKWATENSVPNSAFAIGPARMFTTPCSCSNRERDTCPICEGCGWTTPFVKAEIRDNHRETYRGLTTQIVTVKAIEANFALLTFRDDQTLTCEVAEAALADLKPFLGNNARVNGLATWNRENELVAFLVETVLPRPKPLSQILAENNGRLPLKLKVNSVAELIQQRRSQEPRQ